MKVNKAILRYKKIAKFVGAVAFFLSVFSQHAFASGAYSAGAYPQAKNQYNQGKMIFHKQIKQSKFSTCMKCYKKNKSEKHCEALKFCVSEGLSKPKINALRYFLKKRYRLK